MAFNERPKDFFDQLIIETLHEELGAPPSADVWKRIADEISQPPALQFQAAKGPKQGKAMLPRIYSISQSPYIRRSFIIALFLILLIPSINSQFSLYHGYIQPIVVPNDSESDRTKTALTPTLSQSLVPRDMLWEREQANRTKTHLSSEVGSHRLQPDRGVDTRYEVISTSQIKAKLVNKEAIRFAVWGTELDNKERFNNHNPHNTTFPLPPKPPLTTNRIYKQQPYKIYTAT